MDESQKTTMVTLSNLRVTWTECSILAIKTSPNGELGVEDVYKYIEHFFPDKIENHGKWKNSVRHSIATNNNMFAKKKGLEEKRSHLHYIVPEMNEKIDAERNKGHCLLFAIRIVRKINIADYLWALSSNDPSLPHYLHTNLAVTIRHDNPATASEHNFEYRAEKKEEEERKPKNVAHQNEAIKEALIRKAWEDIAIPSETFHPVEHFVPDRVITIHAPSMKKKELVIKDERKPGGGKIMQPTFRAVPPSNQSTGLRPNEIHLARPNASLNPTHPMMNKSFLPYPPTRFKPVSQSMITSIPKTNTVKMNNSAHAVVTTPMVRQQPTILQHGAQSSIDQHNNVFSDQQSQMRHASVQSTTKGHPSSQFAPSHPTASTNMIRKNLPSGSQGTSHPHNLHPARHQHHPYASGVNIHMRQQQHKPISYEELMQPRTHSIPSTNNIIKTDSTSHGKPLDLTLGSKSLTISRPNPLRSIDSVESATAPIHPNAPSSIPNQSLRDHGCTQPTPSNPVQVHPKPSILQSRTASLLPPHSNPSFHPSQTVIHPLPSTLHSNLLPSSSVHPMHRLPACSIQRMTSTTKKIRQVGRRVWPPPTNNDDKEKQPIKMDGRIERKEVIASVIPIIPSVHPSTSNLPPPSLVTKTKIVTENTSAPYELKVPSTMFRDTRIMGHLAPIPPMRPIVPRVPTKTIVESGKEMEPSTSSSINIVPTTVPQVPTKTIIEPRKEMEPSSSGSINIVLTTVSQVPTKAIIEPRKEMEPSTSSSINIVPTVPQVPTKTIIEPRKEMEPSTSSSINIVPTTVPHVETREDKEEPAIEGSLTEIGDISQPMEVDSKDDDMPPLEMEYALDDFEEDMSSMDITEKPMNQVVHPVEIVRKTVITHSNTSSNQRPHILRKEGDSIRPVKGYKFVPAHPPLLSAQPIQPSNPTVIDLSKSCFTKAHHTSLPAPMKRKEVEEIGLINPKLAIRPVIKPVQVKVNETLKKIPTVVIREAPKSQIALSLIERKKDEDVIEIDGKMVKVSKRRAEKDRFRAAARDETSTPPPIEEEDRKRRNVEKRDERWEEQVEQAEANDGIIFEGTKKKRRIRFYCNSIKFGDEIGFDADNSEKSNSNGRTMDIDDEFDDDDNCPWKDSIIEFTIKATEKEREAQRIVDDGKTDEQRKKERRKEIQQLKKEGKPVTKMENDGRRKKPKKFDVTIDRFIESEFDSQSRRDRFEFKSYLEKKPQYKLEKHSPFFLSISIGGIQRNTPYKREHQRLHFVKVNPNPNLPLILSGGHNRSMGQHSYLSGNTVNNHRPHYTYANDGAWSYCGHYIIATGTDKLVAVIDPEGNRTIIARRYAEDVPIGARFTENNNLAVVATKSGTVNIVDWREDGKAHIISRITGMPDITCMDTNPMNWAKTAFGCENGMVTEYDFYEDHRKSTRDSYYQYFFKDKKDPIFSSLPYEEYDDLWDRTPIKSIRYCSSEYSNCIDDIVITKSNRNDNRSDSAYKFSPGRTRPVVTYTPPSGINLSCATFAYNHNRVHQKKHNSSLNYIVAGTEEGTVVAFDAETGKLLKGGTAVINDDSLLGNNELRYLKDMDPIASICNYIPIRKYFPHEKATISPDLATRITAIDSVPDHKMGTFVVGGWGVNPVINVYKFHDDSGREHFLKI